jgi:hypothetical protein
MIYPLSCDKFRNHHREPLFGHGNTFDRGRPVVLSPNSYIHVSVSDFYIPMISLPILLQQNRQADPGKK